MTLTVETIYTAAVADDQHKLADEAGGGVFNELAESAKAFGTRAAWEDHVRTVEDEYMERTQKSNPDAKTKGSKKTPSRWKYAKYLPKAWSSAKSVVGQALDHGIYIDGSVGKTAVENTLKEKKNALKSDKTPREKILIMQESIRKVLAQLPEEERHSILTDLGVDVNKSIVNWG